MKTAGVTSGKVQVSFQNTVRCSQQLHTYCSFLLWARRELWIPCQRWANETCLAWVGNAEVWIHPLLRVNNLLGHGAARKLSFKGETSLGGMGEPTFGLWRTCYPTVPVAAPSYSTHSPIEEGRRAKSIPKRHCPSGAPEKRPALWHCSVGSSHERDY